MRSDKMRLRAKLRDANAGEKRRKDGKREGHE
jgi:hypothetical protein